MDRESVVGGEIMYGPIHHGSTEALQEASLNSRLGRMYYLDPDMILDNQLEASKEREDVREYGRRHSAEVHRQDGNWQVTDGSSAEVEKYEYVVLHVDRAEPKLSELGSVSDEEARSRKAKLVGHRSLNEAVANAASILNEIPGSKVDRWKLENDEGYVLSKGRYRTTCVR